MAHRNGQNHKCKCGNPLAIFRRNNEWVCELHAYTPMNQNPNTNKECNGTHCRCMNLDGECAKIHYADCVKHNPYLSTPSPKDWEDRFDKEFPFGSFAGSSTKASEVKEFIRQERTNAQKEIAKEIYEVYMNDKLGTTETLSKIMHSIKHLLD